MEGVDGSGKNALYQLYSKPRLCLSAEPPTPVGAISKHFLIYDECEVNDDHTQTKHGCNNQVGPFIDDSDGKTAETDLTIAQADIG
jgi:hypothetical protein